jgi:hypothetical protein
MKSFPNRASYAVTGRVAAAKSMANTRLILEAYENTSSVQIERRRGRISTIISAVGRRLSGGTEKTKRHEDIEDAPGPGQEGAATPADLEKLLSHRKF